jgi:thiosulfate dehydrogenase [quinone] large subunit
MSSGEEEERSGCKKCSGAANNEVRNEGARILKGHIMATTHLTRRSHHTDKAVPAARTTSDTTTVATTDAPAPSTAVKYFAGGLRLALGWTFLWAFLDKLFGLGFATEKDGAWINGGSPTEGFLAFAAKGPFKGIYNDMAGAAWVDWLFMLGLAGIGTALVLGIFINIASASGALLLVLMWTAAILPENNPFMDDHLINAGLLGLLALLHSGRYLGLGAMWERMPFVQKYPLFR